MHLFRPATITGAASSSAASAAARRASIVIANHALIMIQAARAGENDGELPLRYRLRRGPSSVRCRRQRLRRPSDRAGGGRAAPLADRQRGRADAARAEAPGRGSGRGRRAGQRGAAGECSRPPGAAGRGLASAHRRRASRPPARRSASWSRSARRCGPAPRESDSPHGLEADSAAPPPGLLDHAKTLGHARWMPCCAPAGAGAAAGGAPRRRGRDPRHPRPRQRIEARDPRAEPPGAHGAAGLALHAGGARDDADRRRTSSTGSTLHPHRRARRSISACYRHWVDPTEPLRPQWPWRRPMACW